MAENDATSIPFALVDESGHLTGKPAEGVQAAIAQAVAALPAPLSQASADEVLKTHYEKIMTAVLASNNAKQAVGVSTTDFWGNTAWAGTPEIFRRIIEKMADMQDRPRWGSVLYETIMIETPETYEPLMLLTQQYQTNDNAGVSGFISRDSEGFAGFIIDLFVARQALKVMGVDKLEVVGDNLRVTKDGRTGSVPITWDAA